MISDNIPYRMISAEFYAMRVEISRLSDICMRITFYFTKKVVGDGIWVRTYVHINYVRTCVSTFAYVCINEYTLTCVSMCVRVHVIISTYEALSQYPGTARYF